MRFERIGRYDVTVPGADVVGGVAGTPFSIGAGTVAFNAQGVLNQVNGAVPVDVPLVTPVWTNGAAASTFLWDLVDPAGTPHLSGFADPSSTSSISQNGSPAGQLDTIGVDANGNIVATFGSGETVNLAQLAVATFNNPKGLNKIGNNLFTASQAAGPSNLGTSGTGGRGTLVGAALEQSNVDIALEFTRMILAQRGYQASSRMITVSDELLLETLSLKR